MTTALTAADLAAIAAQGTAGLSLGELVPTTQDAAGDTVLLLPTGRTLVRPRPAPGFWQPFDATKWKRALQIDLREATALPSTVWPYGNASGIAPGGTTGCKWFPNQIGYGPEGIVFNSRWDPTLGLWRCAGAGTQTKEAAPLRARVYERLVDYNLLALNHINLLWCDPWNTEVDWREAATIVAAMGPSHVNIHNESPADDIPTITQSDVQDLALHCYEVELVPHPTLAGEGQISTFTDGKTTGGPEAIPAVYWSLLTTSPHWLGSQTQMYSVGSANQALSSQRIVAALELLVPA